MGEYSPVRRDGKPSEALIIWCSDNDFQPAFREFIEGLGIGKYTPIVEPGPSKLITEDNAVVERAALLESKHGFERVIVLDHINCAYFGIADEKAEIKEHFRMAKMANPILKEAITGLVSVEYHLLGWDGEIFEEQG